MERSGCMTQMCTTGLHVCIKHHTPHTTQHIPHYTTEFLGAAFRCSFVRGALYFGLKNDAMLSFVSAMVVTRNTFVLSFCIAMVDPVVLILYLGVYVRSLCSVGLYNSNSMALVVVVNQLVIKFTQPITGIKKSLHVNFRIDGLILGG